MFKTILQHTRKPVGLLGRIMIRSMNLGHAAMTRWGLSHLPLCASDSVLDLGCGGGAAALRMAKTCAFVCGLDYSRESIRMARQKTASLPRGRCTFVEGSVSRLPFPDGAFSAVTAFETVYFWPNIVGAFKEARRVLSPGGRFMIVNEAQDPEKNRVYTDIIHGMTVYTGRQLSGLLTEAGFQTVTLHTHKKGWVCLIAEG